MDEEQVGRNTKFIREIYMANIRREPPTADLDYWLTALGTTHTPQDVSSEIANCPEALLHKKSRLFTYPGHFYSPIVDKDEAIAFFGQEARHQKNLSALPGINLDRSVISRNWHQLLPFMQTNPFPENKSTQYRYYFANDSFSYGDGYVFNAIIRRFGPKRVIEIGCGWSSACLLDTLKYQSSSTCQVTFIEPYPELLFELMGKDPEQVKVIPQGVQQAPLSVFDELDRGDILFIDSTHVLKTNSDVHFEFFEILPRIRPGVLVHFHDIFWPFEYPRQWVVDDNRSWNELYGLRALLSDSSAWQIFMFNDYAANILDREIIASFPQFLKNPGGSFWMIKS